MLTLPQNDRRLGCAGFGVTCRLTAMTVKRPDFLAWFIWSFLSLDRTRVYMSMIRNVTSGHKSTSL